MGLTSSDVARIEDYEPGDVWGYRARLVCLLALDGLTMEGVRGLTVNDVLLDLGLVRCLDGRLVPVRPITVEALRQWLEVRPQRGAVVALITIFGKRDTGKPMGWALGRTLGKDITLLMERLGLPGRARDLYRYQKCHLDKLTKK